MKESRERREKQKGESKPKAYPGPWERDTTLDPKVLVVFGSHGSCPKCEKWIGTYSVTQKRSLDDILKDVELPPYHPNCDCNYRIEYGNASSYMTAAQLQEVLTTFRTIRDHYASLSSPGHVDNYLLLLPFVKEHERGNEREILADLENWALKSCGARAGELKVLFENYLRSRPYGTSGCKLNAVWNVTDMNSIRQALTAHAWVRFDYAYLDARGGLQTDSEDFDAWEFTIDDWKTWIARLRRSLFPK